MPVRIAVPVLGIFGVITAYQVLLDLSVAAGLGLTPPGITEPMTGPPQPCTNAVRVR